jgi:hypothetical protein
VVIGLLAAGSAAADDGTAFFESKVRPLLIARCYECHSGAKTKGGLSLDTRAGWQKGGDSGTAIVPGKPEESLLIKAVSYHDADLAMPPESKGGKLPDADIAALSEWVKLGAPDPRIPVAQLGGMKLEDANAWWAFQPLPAAEKEASSAKIDEFINAKIAEAGLTPNPAADKRTLIRRATYDLTGLPPTPEEVDAFVADPSSDAFAKVVERLLASPQYGVQWGRHWLDVVRYADTAGENTDRPLPHAWRYRNWVFDAFNRDLPYDQFVRLQLAGDILRASGDRAEAAEGVIATGYLAVARRFGHDIDKDVYLTYEDVIDNLGKNFLGMTIACARCHDHKYDPITSQDYYALYGIFGSTRFAFPGCEPKGQPRDLVPLIPQAEVDAVMKPWQAEVAKAEAEKKRRAAALASSAQQVKDLTARGSRLLAENPVAEGASVALEDGAVEPLDHVAVRKGEVIQLSILPNATHGSDSTRIELEIAEVGGAERKWNIADLIPSLTEGNPHAANDGAAWCFLETTNGPVFLSELRDAVNGRSDLKAWNQGSDPSVFVNTSDQQVMVWTTLPAQSFFVHPGPKRPVAVAWLCPLDGAIRIAGRVTDAHPANLDGVAFKLEHFASPEIGPVLASWGQELRAAQQATVLPPEPVFPLAYGVAEAGAKNARVQQRGDPEKLGEEVPRRWLSVFGGDVVPSDAGSGRKQLGDWIAAQPLAARVMVNRIWQGHFGQSLVRSPNDFGSRGERPTHPELLDSLAAQFQASGYSIKAMHRLIMNTAVYQRGSGRSEELATHDADNRLLARYARRRLAAEEIRDSLLVAAGRLDFAPAEAHPFPPENTWKFTQHNPFNAVYETDKRSAYLMVQRQRRHPFLALFDGADPNASTPARQTTTVPTQALYFLNDPFFHAQAARFAETLLKAPDDAARIAAAYRTLFQREPNSTEREHALSFLDAYPAAETEKWTAYARVLLAGNELLHLD